MPTCWLILRFTTEDIGSSNILKSSAQRAMKKSLMDQFASVSEEMIEEMLPKKANIVATKWYLAMPDIALIFQY